MIDVTCIDEATFRFDPVKTALLIIDMQRNFLDSNIALANWGLDVRPFQALIPGIRQILEGARHAGLTIVYTREGFAPDQSDVHALRNEVDPVGQQTPLGRALIRGEPGHAITEELQPENNELVIDKAGYSAFVRTSLDEELRTRGISHLIVTGITTECCVSSTLRVAVDLGYYCLLIENCCAGSTRELHNNVIKWIEYEKHCYGWLASQEAVSGVLST